MDPSPDDVRWWFSASLISDAALTAYLVALTATPHWSVIATGEETFRTLVLVHVPGGPRLDVALDWTTAGWIPHVS